MRSAAGEKMGLPTDLMYNQVKWAIKAILSRRMVLRVLGHLGAQSLCWAFLGNNKTRNYMSNRPDNTWLAYLCGYLARYRSGLRPIWRRVTYMSPNGKITMSLMVSEYTQSQYFFCAPDPCLKRLIVKGGTTFIDAGANVGIFSLMAAHYFETVISFEPIQRTFEQLSLNVELSELNNMVIVPMALSSTSGQVTMSENPLNQGGAKVGAFDGEYMEKSGYRDGWTQHKIDCTALDDWVEANKVQSIDLMKIDVEGHEQDVLAGARRAVEHFEPVLFIEVLTESSFNKILALLPRSYKAWDAITGLEMGKYSSPNIVFSKEVPF